MRGSGFRCRRTDLYISDLYDRLPERRVVFLPSPLWSNRFLSPYNDLSIYLQSVERGERHNSIAAGILIGRHFGGFLPFSSDFCLCLRDISQADFFHAFSTFERRNRVCLSNRNSLICIYHIPSFHSSHFSCPAYCYFQSFQSISLTSMPLKLTIRRKRKSPANTVHHFLMISSGLVQSSA